MFCKIRIQSIGSRRSHSEFGPQFSLPLLHIILIIDAARTKSRLRPIGFERTLVSYSLTGEESNAFTASVLLE